jgi:hypothetical protein
MKLKSVEVGRVAAAGREKRVVIVRVELDQPQESMRITVVVPEQNDEKLALEYGLAKAKDAARKFGLSSSTPTAASYTRP